MRVSRQLLLLIAIVLFLLPLLTACSEATREYPVEVEAEDTQARVDSIRFRRMYPYSYMPANARDDAWKVVLKEESEPGLRWQTIGPNSITSKKGTVSGRINTVAVSPADENLILIGSATGGIWRSQDGGKSFAPVSDNHADLAVGSLAFFNGNPNIIYAGMGDPLYGFLGNGVLKSTDNGASWTEVNNRSLPSPSTIASIGVDPEDPNFVYLAQHSKDRGDVNSGFFLSSDGGTSWRQTLKGEVRDLVTNPEESRIIYAAMESGDRNPGLAGVYRTSDSGATWQQMISLAGNAIPGSPVVFDSDAPLYIKIATTAHKPNSIYAFVSGTVNKQATNQLIVSADTGTSWTAQTVNSVDAVQPEWNLYIAVDPRNANNIYVGTLDINKSTDGGATWTNLTRNCTVQQDDPTNVIFTGEGILHVDQHKLVFSRHESGTIFVTNDGGLFKSTNGGVSYTSLNSTLSLAQFYSIAAHPGHENLFYGGTQDNGTVIRTGSSLQWKKILGADGGECVVCSTDPSKLFATIAGSSIFLLDWKGNNSLIKAKTFDDRIGFDYPFLEMNGILYVGTNRLWVSTVGCDRLNSSSFQNSWSAPGGDQDLTRGITKFGKDTLSAIGVCLSDPNTIYTGSEQGQVMVSSDGGKSWMKVESDKTSGIPERCITSITVDAKNPAIAFLTVSGFDTTHVFKTTDTGVTWRSISGNLHDITGGDIAVNDLLITDEGLLYIGTDIGVFMSRTGGDKWVSVRTGMPPVIVREFAINSKGDLLAATFGRGVYILEVENR